MSFHFAFILSTPDKQMLHTCIYVLSQLPLQTFIFIIVSLVYVESSKSDGMVCVCVCGGGGGIVREFPLRTVQNCVVETIFNEH